ncbi:sensor histidine kinase [Streptomonospora sp. S1-112]|uniref:Sensor histidine kinase n=1 Tax=Streptomonospora mangrovi TaxID=2883123 RepID=A0A9X3NIB1_9ACTN|nr:sensor histidine kinase [Streptomonospora mangrovi]MDA0564334.1 sensor histidine kinase [Streptomonospora mangrovi]
MGDPHLTHQACLFGSDEEFLAMALPFVGHGVDSGDPVLAALTPATAALLRQALGARSRGVDYRDPAAFGHRPPDRLAAIDGYWREHAARGRAERVRILAEPVWAGRSAREVAAWTYLESALTPLFGATNLWLVCPYDTRRVPAHVAEAACLTHPELVQGGRTRASDAFVPPAAFAAGGAVAEPTSLPGDLMGGPFTPADLPRLRRDALAYAGRLGVPRPRALDLAFAVNEVASNVILHGGGTGSVWFWTEDDEVVCEVAQDTAYLAVPPFAGSPPALDELCGGLWIVRQLCDRVHLGSMGGRSVVRLHLLRGG